VLIYVLLESAQSPEDMESKDLCSRNVADVASPGKVSFARLRMIMKIRKG
jgi:hypothetical protein